MMQDRQRERGGLAGSGLRDSDHVAARHDDRNCLRLDWCRSEVFFFGERTRDCVIKSKVVKICQTESFLFRIGRCAFAAPGAKRRACIAGKGDTPRDLGCLWKGKCEPEAVDAGVRTRGSLQA